MTDPTNKMLKEYIRVLRSTLRAAKEELELCIESDVPNAFMREAVIKEIQACRQHQLGITTIGKLKKKIKRIRSYEE